MPVSRRRMTAKPSYLDANDVRLLIYRVGSCLRAAGDVVLVHWMCDTHYPLTDDEAAERFIADAGDFLRVHGQARTDKYRLDVLVGREGR